MRSVWIVARHDLRMILADRSALLWLFVLPIVFAGFFGLVIGGGSGGPRISKAHVTLDDRDGGPVARRLVEEMAGEELVVVPVADLEEGASPYRTLVLPEGLSERVLAGEQVTVQLITEPDTSSEAALLAQARIVAAAARVIAQLVLASGDGAPATAEQLLAVELPPDLVRVESRFAGTVQPVPGGFAHSVPGNVTFFLLLVTLTLGSASLSAERQAGLIRRLATAPLRPWQIVGGKIAGRAACGIVQVTVLIGAAAAAELVLDLGLAGHLAEMLVILAVFALAVAPLGVLVGALFTDPDRAASVGVIATMVMAALGGCWWPLEIVSEPLQKVALLFPTGWAMTALHGVVSFGHGLGGVATSLVALAAFAVAFTLVASRSLRV